MWVIIGKVKMDDYWETVDEIKVNYSGDDISAPHKEHLNDVNASIDQSIPIPIPTPIPITITMPIPIISPGEIKSCQGDNCYNIGAYFNGKHKQAETPAMVLAQVNTNGIIPEIVSLPGGVFPIPAATLRALYLPNEQRPTLNILQLLSTEKLRIVVTGGAGFVGSHLVDRLMILGHTVIVIDNLQTGRRENVQHWVGHPDFTLLIHDVSEPLWLECDRIYHLACPASPPAYQQDEIRTVKTCVIGTMNMLGLAKRTKARLLLASTSEVYGDPEIHPQQEDYRGCVSTIGLRACYDEGKRCAETLAYCYHRQCGVEVRVARIFNTYGPRMDPTDGRVVSNFITQALSNEPLTIYGDGNQTRSFQFVHDLVSGLMALMESGCSEPVNLGNPEEYPIRDFANIIRGLVNSNSEIVHMPGAPDDPKQRRPDISRAKKMLDWSPEYSLRAGLVDTVDYFRRLSENRSR